MLKRIHNAFLCLFQAFTDETMRLVIQDLSREKLLELCFAGQDVSKHIIDTVRELHITINIKLRELGVGSIGQETTSI